MDSLRAAYWNRTFSHSSLNNLGKILTLLLVLAVAAGASAAPVLSRVSCTRNAYSAAATDACSVYLVSKTSSRFHVTLTSNNPAIAVPSNVTVKPGAMSTGFSATVSGVTTVQTATITAQAGGIATTYNITLSPASASPALTLNATSISFGAVVVNSATTQTVMLTSSGTAAVTVNSVAVTGGGFSVSSMSLPTTLNPGQTAIVTLTFAPSSVGSATGQLTVGSNSSANPTMTVSLSGTGDPHQVDLSWLAPTGSTTPITGYNVYRSTGGTGSFALVNSVGTQTAYTDLNVQSGQSYDYYVTSVDSSSMESLPSNTTAISVP